MTPKNEIISCPICSGSTSEHVKIKGNINFQTDKKVYRLSICHNCQHIFRTNYLDKEIYSKDYYAYHASSSPISRLASFLFIRAKNFPANVLWGLFQNSTRYLNCPFLEKRNVLDFGGGDGFALDLYRQTSCNTYNIEIDERVIQQNREKGHHAYKRPEQIKEKLDFIRANQVLEHVSDPQRVVNGLFPLLKKGGRVLIGIPNIRSASYLIFKGNFDQMSLPDHHHFFSEKSIRLLLKQFRKIEIYYPPHKYGIFTNLYTILEKKNVFRNSILAVILQVISLPINILTIPFKRTHLINIVATK